MLDFDDSAPVEDPAADAIPDDALPDDEQELAAPPPPAAKAEEG